MLTRPLNAIDIPPLDDLFEPVAAHAIIGVAVSGGADSLALLLLAAQWVSDCADKKLIVYTVDHGLRAEAAAESKFVAKTAESLGLTARILRWDAQKPDTGIQAAARAARYEMIGEAMRADDATVLLTGHHLRDQVETVLMRMAHGSGVTGLGGMSNLADVHGVQVCRPLLQVAPDVLVKIVERAGLQAVSDPSNNSDHYERVRWRKKMPDLVELGLDEARLGQLALRLRRAETALQNSADNAFSDLAEVDEFGVVRIDRARFDAQDAEIQVRVLRMALSLAGDGLKPYALQQVENLLAQMSETGPVANTTLSGTAIARTKNSIVFYREVGRIGAGVVEIAPGGVYQWDNRFLISNNSDAIVSVGLAGQLKRDELGDILGKSIAFPVIQLAGAPIVRSLAKQVLSVGTRVLDGCVGVEFMRKTTQNSDESR